MKIRQSISNGLSFYTGEKAMSNIKDAKRRRQRRRRKRQIQRALLILAMILILIGFIFLVRTAVRAIVGKLTEPAVTTVTSDTQKSAKQSSKKTTDKKTTDKKAGTKSKKNSTKAKTQKVKDSDGNTIESETVTISKKDKKASDKVSLTISSTGDCTLGTDENFNYSTSLNAYYESHGADYFFQHVRSIFEKDDLSIVNMEGTLTDETAREAKTFAFKAPAKYASILSGSSIEAANLANNHSHDYGEKSYTDTISALDDAGIASFGYNRIKILKVKGIKVGVTGIYELADHQERASQVKENIKALKNAGAQLIIVNFHWGIEKQYTPDENQKALAHLAIDEGADLVIGHHPHVLEGIEEYNGKYICYSLGNFCFGGNSTPSDTDSMIVQQTFTFNKGTLKKSSELNIIPCSITSSSGYNDYCPVPLTGSEKERVLNKISQYSEGL